MAERAAGTLCRRGPVRSGHNSAEAAREARRGIAGCFGTIPAPAAGNAPCGPRSASCGAFRGRARVSTGDHAAPASPRRLPAQCLARCMVAIARRPADMVGRRQWGRRTAKRIAGGFCGKICYNNEMKNIALPLIIFLVLTNHARADCASPAGVAGTMEYFTAENTFKFCNGTDWIDMGASGGGGTLNCTTNEIDYGGAGSISDQCDAGETATGGGCTTGGTVRITHSVPFNNGWSCGWSGSHANNGISVRCCTIQ